MRTKEEIRESKKKWRHKNKDKVHSEIKRYRHKNREKVNEYNREYRQKNKEKVRKRDRDNRQKTRERVREREKEYYKKDRDKVLLRAKKYWQTHREEILARNKKYSQSEKGKKVLLAANQKRRFLKRYANKYFGGHHTWEEWDALMEMYGYRCLCCGKKEPEIKLTRDHIIPLLLGGSNLISNMQPLCRSCNSIKGIKCIDFRPKK